jgi:membrane-bound serine protease (ClpP class)
MIIIMDTYGGAVNDADDIRTRILEYPKPVWVFINKNAASAGALISIACDSIYMASGSSIGAATVVTQDGSAAPDKYQSYMRSIMRSTAEANGRDPRIAEAMVDEDIEIEGISEAGEVITFSTSEAIKYDFCEGEINSLEELLERYEIDNYTIEEFRLSSTEKIIRVFLNPVISGILILIILGGIYFELQTPGVGFPLLAAVIAAVLYFIPYYLNGMAENWEIILFVVGVALLALEVFVIPGFGIAGISGLVLSIGSLILVMLNNDLLDFSFVKTEEIFQAVASILVGLFGSIILMFFGGIRMTNTRFFKRIALQGVQDRKDGYTSNFKVESLLGKSGKTYTVLRPSGKVIIDDVLYDAYTRGDYIQKDEEIIVVGEEGTSLKVRKKTEQDK